MTQRERLLARLERRREWAASRERKAAQAWDAHYNVPLPPFGEPIKIGHHSERRHRAVLDRSAALAFKAIEHQKMAEHHEHKAAGLADQLDRSIFSDDADAVARLEARITEREAERDRIKAFNESCRKGTPNPELLDEKQRADLETIRRVCPYQLGPRGEMPGYALTNLAANIRRDRERIEQIKRRAARQHKAEAAGGVLIDIRGEWAIVTFAEKPARDILNALRAAGFRWGRGSWSGPADALPDCVKTLATQQEN